MMAQNWTEPGLPLEGRDPWSLGDRGGETEERGPDKLRDGRL